MILIYEPWATDFHHYEFNKCFLKSILLCFKDEKILYVASKSHIDNLRTDFNGANVEFITVNIRDYFKTKKLYLLFNEFKNLLSLKKYRPRLTIVTDALPHTIFFFKFLFPKKEVVFVMHNILESLNRRNKLYNIDYYTKFSIKYNIQQGVTKYLVLGQSIYKNVVKIIPDLSIYFVYTDHPYTFSHKENKALLRSRNYYNIGGIGYGVFDKGSHLIFEVENRLNKSQVKNINLFHVGKLNFVIPDNTLVKISTKDEFLSKVEYDELVSQLDFILFFYPVDSYKLTASGAIFDAISQNKPIIALKNDYFEAVFEKLGEIGYLANDFEELMSYILSVARNEKNSDVLRFIKNLEGAHKLFSPEVVSIQLKDIFKLYFT